MAKKATAKKVEVAPQELPTPPKVVETPRIKKPSWEIKDRTYILIGNDSPLTHTMPSKHSARYPLLWFDEEKGEQKELRYATNQNSPFVEEQKGESTLGHIVFRDGVLNVEKEKQNLQKLLSLYHPLIGKKFVEFDSSQEAVEELDDIDLQIDALNAARDMDIEQAEAIVRVEQGSKVSSMKSSEIKRDLMMMAKENPGLFINLANDENVGLRNIAIKAVEMGIIKISQDQRTFHWGSNNRKLMTVPFDENPYSAMAAFFKTDEGVEVYRSVEKMIK
jgi:hypothetical protein